MKTSDFDYELPSNLIARFPLQKRDASRLLCLNRTNGNIDHRLFHDLPNLLCAGDRLVFNDTRVIPARLFCKKKGTGAAIELLFVERLAPRIGIAMARPAKKLDKGTIITPAGAPGTELMVDEILPDGQRRILLQDKSPFSSIDELLQQCGVIPLPPYLNREAEPSDRERYQTVYASNDGAVAAPTAGLHFTKELLDDLQKRGVASSALTLHVGPGTFKPVSEEDPLRHPMHKESYIVCPQCADEINETARAGGRIIAVGTTVVRVLEHCAVAGEPLRPGSGSTDIFILPGYTFKCVNAMITNFHLPRSTLLMLVAAFGTTGQTMSTYRTAVESGYRFYSYGDAMFIS